MIAQIRDALLARLPARLDWLWKILPFTRLKFRKVTPDPELKRKAGGRR